MIHLKSYQPTHEQMARIEHAIVVNRRRYYALHEAGALDLAEQAHLELDYLNLCYWKHHSQGIRELKDVKNNGNIASGTSRSPDAHPNLERRI